MAGHKADAARIAREVVAGRKHGRHVRIGQHSFDTTPKRQNGSPRGMCSRFVRQVLEEAMGLAEGKLGSGNGGVMACCAAGSEARMKERGYRVRDPAPGDVICFKPNGPRCKTCGRQVGHIGLWLGDGMVAENTSSGRRGNPRAAGTKITSLSAIGASRVSGYYAVLPGGVETTLVKLVVYGTEPPEVVAVVRMVAGGDHVSDQGKIYIEERE